MEASTLVAILTATFVAMFLPMVLAAVQSREEQANARERRMAEHRMNARLLRFNI